MAVGILRRLETMLREKLGRPELVLSDYFDLIGGTSTEAIIAAALALGKTTDDLEHLYRNLGPRIFRHGFFNVPGIQPKFDPRLLERALREELGESTLGDADWKCGFAAIAKRLDTGSVWVMSNCPKSKYWEGDPDEMLREPDPALRRVTPNKAYPLAKVVQASAAAPFFFDLVPMEVEKGKPGVFFDGAITPHGNPALQLAMTALAPAYGLSWKPGEEQLLIISVGTGAHRPMKPGWVKPPLLAIWKALHALMSMAYDTSQLAIVMLQWLGESPQPWHISGEVGGMEGARPAGMAPLWTFIRYDAPLERDWLQARLGVNLADKGMAALQRIDDDRQIPRLFEIGLGSRRQSDTRRAFPRRFQSLTGGFDPPQPVSAMAALLCLADQVGFPADFLGGHIGQPGAALGLLGVVFGHAARFQRQIALLHRHAAIGEGGHGQQGQGGDDDQRQ